MSDPSYCFDGKSFRVMCILHNRHYTWCTREPIVLELPVYNNNKKIKKNCCCNSTRVFFNAYLCHQTLAHILYFIPTAAV